MAVLLGYEEWRNFENAIKKAKLACYASNADENYHFVETNKMIRLPKNAIREVRDYALSCYACYLIIQNADPAKPMVAAGQTYFAIQTRRQELTDQHPQLKEDKKRVLLRNEMKIHNKQLAATARRAGVESTLDYAIFQDYGYKGLYGGLGMKEIKARRSQKESKHPRPYGKHRTGRQSVSRHTN